MNTTTKFETGAKTHAVNDLILYADNTRELAELKTAIFHRLWGQNPEIKLSEYLTACQSHYAQELPDHTHIDIMTASERLDFINLTFEQYQDWKKENAL